MDSTRKVVCYNKYGSFQLPKEIAVKLAEKKRIKLEGKFCHYSFSKYIAMPCLGTGQQGECPVQRHDPILVELVEEWISKHGEESGLAIKEIPKGKYIIQEYDGLEKVICPDDICWVETG